MAKGQYDRSTIVAQRELKKNIMLGKVKPPSEIVQKKLDDMTDAEVAAQIRERFRVMGKLTDSVIRGSSRAEIISGPPGLGKSYDIEQKMKLHSPSGTETAHIKGFARTTGIYKKLYQKKNEGNLVVFDDADSIFANIDSLNILKAACDTTEDRWISYLAETSMVDDISGDPLPTQFEFKGSVIFITNYDFDDKITQGDTNSEHFAALMSRSHYLSLMMKTRREYMIRVRMVAEEQGLFNNYNITADQCKMILDYMEERKEELREVSLRMAIKIATLVRDEAEDWKYMTDITCLRPEHSLI